MKVILTFLSRKGRIYLNLPAFVNPLNLALIPADLFASFFSKSLMKFIMRLNVTVLLLCMMLGSVSAFTFGQQITLKKSNSSFDQIIKEVEEQSGYTFFYKKEDVAAIKPLTVDFQKEQFKTALDKISRTSGLSYDIFGNTVVFKKNKTHNSRIPERASLSKNERAVVPVQQQYVKGRVVDEEDKPIAGVLVALKNSPKRAVSTNDKGEYNLPISADGEVVVFSFIGYSRKEVRVSLNKEIVVKLERSNQDIEEVVISTGIFKKDEQSFTGSSTTVTAEELRQFGTRNLVTSLRNIDPSFNIIESNMFGSDPNRIPEIQIRGNSNIPNVQDLQNESRVGLNTPLIILDGFQSSLQKLLDINENDVESITILKDAAATAMYGSRGANGVVVITTKMPAPGKLRVSFGTQMNIENPDLSDYNLLNSRDKLELERLAGYYDFADPDIDFTLKSYYNYILGEVNRGVNTDWLSVPLRTSVGQRHNLRLEGGDQALRYSASLQYNNIAGVMKGSSRNTLNGGIMLSYSLDNIKFRNNTQISQGKSSESPYGTFSDYSQLNPYWAPYDDDGNVNKVLGHPGNTTYQRYWTTLPTNPLYNASLKTYDTSEQSEIINNTSIEWNITRDLLLRGQFGINKKINQNDRFRPADHTAFANYGIDDLFRRGDYLYGVGNSLGYDGSFNLAYNKVFHAKHNFYGAFDFNVRQDKTSTYSFLAEGFTNPRLDFLSSALQYAEGGAPSGSENFTRAVGFSTNASYNYDNKYFTDLLFRYDGSSQFGSQKRFAPFWSFGLGWNMHEETFLRDVDFVNRLKLRGSTGIVGSQSFSAYQALTSYKYYTDQSYYNWNGAYILGLGNDELMWQETQKHNIGADIELWNRRINIKADLYKETTKDLVSSINLPASNGFKSYIENVGSLENRGFEAQLTFILLNKPTNGWFWSVTGSLLRNKNKVLETSQAMKDALEAVKNNSTNPGIVYEEGYSSNTIWVVPSLGIDPSNGKEVYLDVNGTPTYEWKGTNVVAAGSTEAKMFGNFSTLVRYKEFSVNAVFRYTLGGHQYNSTLASKVESSSYKYQMDERVFYDRWMNPGDEAVFKGILVTTPTYKTSRFVQKENTLILSNVNLQYDLRNSPWLQRMGIESLNITGNISEPLYLSTIKRERGTSYPFSRQFSFGFNVIF